jgi:hypothetical protein
MRFTRDEREAFTPGTAVIVKLGSYEYPAVIVGPVAGDVVPRIPIRITSVLGRKGTVRIGDTWEATPGHIRINK